MGGFLLKHSSRERGVTPPIQEGPSTVDKQGHQVQLGEISHVPTRWCLRARGSSVANAPPPPGSPALDKPHRPPAFLVWQHEKGLSMVSRSDNSIYRGFFMYLGSTPRVFGEIFVLLISGGILCP